MPGPLHAWPAARSTKPLELHYLCMAISVSRLRRWLAVAGILACLIIIGVYFHGRRGVQNALKQVPEKLNVEIRQSATGFTISKSEQGKTLFKLQASKAVQFKQGGRADLRDVMITIYGRDSSRFDQVYGKEFEYDQQTGNVTSKGEVSIDLQSNSQGASAPDQATPRELKNPVHLKTTDLVFNQKSGDAWTPARVEFYVPQMSGSALGARYDARQSVLTLESHVSILVSGASPLKLFANHATLGKNPREIRLQRPRAESEQETGEADEATLFLLPDDTLDHVLATGNIAIRTAGFDSSNPRAALPPTAKPNRNGPLSSNAEVTAQKLEVVMSAHNQITQAIFSQDVHLKITGPQPSEGTAGRATLHFSKRNALSSIHADQQVTLRQHQGAANNPTQDLVVSAPAMDFLVGNGNRLTSAETFGPPEIRLLPSEGKAGQQTTVTADKFTAKFDSLGQISQVHGEAHAKVVAIAPTHSDATQSERVSTSDVIDAHFEPGAGIQTIIQQGHFSYQSGTQQAFAAIARYTPADQILLLTGSPRFIDSASETTAETMRLNRADGQAFAFGNVKTTYNQLKPQPNGGMLASSDPIHVTAERMTAYNSPAVAVYTGNARLWQDANVVQAPTIQFQKEARRVVADSNAPKGVTTNLISEDKNGKATAVFITAEHLTYSDAERKARYEGDVVAQGPDVTIRCAQMDVFFAPSSLPAAQQSSATGEVPAEPQAKLEKIIASGSVVVTQPLRRATGDRLIYTASDDKFVLNGGPPSIFDAEHGKITGDSLTLYRTDDRVIVDGSSSSPAVTRTRVVR
jgi:lipopolysaccharide export system protein LptA